MAGGIAGTASTLFNNPFDTIKTRMQKQGQVCVTRGSRREKRAEDEERKGGARGEKNVRVYLYDDLESISDGSGQRNLQRERNTRLLCWR